MNEQRNSLNTIIITRIILYKKISIGYKKVKTCQCASKRTKIKYKEQTENDESRRKSTKNKRKNQNWRLKERIK